MGFPQGTFGTVLSGSVTGHGFLDYQLDAREGQALTFALTVTRTDGDGTAYLNVLPPGSTGAAIYVGSMDEDGTETVSLPEDGTYTLRVYLMGNDRDAGKTVGFDLDVSIR
ncbi:hypothetical protein [Salipiger mangrovisoli]|uniref:hypothetical protein n=1 Tax=Salipiger mangrovisoli TaxID=2865933 RepID=UPI0030B85F3F